MKQNDCIFVNEKARRMVRDVKVTPLTKIDMAIHKGFSETLVTPEEDA